MKTLDAASTHFNLALGVAVATPVVGEARLRCRPVFAAASPPLSALPEPPPRWAVAARRRLSLGGREV